MNGQEPHVVQRVPPWGPIVISLLLLALASYSLVAASNQPMAGVIIGYVAGYWLPGAGPRIFGPRNG